MRRFRDETSYAVRGISSTIDTDLEINANVTIDHRVAWDSDTPPTTMEFLYQVPEESLPEIAAGAMGAMLISRFAKEVKVQALECAMDERSTVAAVKLGVNRMLGLGLVQAYEAAVNAITNRPGLKEVLETVVAECLVLVEPISDTDKPKDATDVLERLKREMESVIEEITTPREEDIH